MNDKKIDQDYKEVINSIKILHDFIYYKKWPKITKS